MKEIKAFVRQHRIANVLAALRDTGHCDMSNSGNGCHNITISKVQRPLASGDPTQQHYSMELAEAVVAEYKLELVCADDVVDVLADAIAMAAATGQAEAGWIFMSEVQRAVRIA
ncbi:P-II family nitrogen regulator [Cupriavidus sp. Agwp_2]|uniref:P-II family nitrogen regulator n=1 Tax=Cupriavidus sp. Agwp_2 TaxID=2897324 RepID=UPI003460AD1F